jgi:VCBS repeat-containing protein
MLPTTRLASLLRPQPHRFALESRQLFDGAALVVAATAHTADSADSHHAEAPPPAPPPVAPAAPPAPLADHDAGRGTDHSSDRSPATTTEPTDHAVATLAPATSAADHAPHVVYVVDQSVADWQQVVGALPKGSDVILIDAASDGATQLANALRGRTDISALSIVSHGAAGEITLGNSTITAGNIAEHAAAWQAIGASLTANGDILLYGCDVAQQGNGLLQQMASLTGADIAASTNATGATRLGGDWALEASVGHIEARAFADNAYDGLLAQPTLDGTATKLSVTEPSALNATGADTAQLTGWTIADASGNVSVTVSVDGLVNGVADGTPDTLVGGLTSGAGGTAVSSLTFTGTVAAANAWLNGIVFHATDTELGLTAAQAVVKITVTDSLQPLSATKTLAVTVTPSNDPTILGNSSQSVAEVGNTVLTAAALNALDPEVDATTPTQTPSQIIYTVTANPTYGYLLLGGTRLGVGSIFTQADVIANNVIYVHTGVGADQNTADSFAVRVNDGATPDIQSDPATITLSITPFNQLPTASGSGNIYEGQPANAHDGATAQSDVGSFITASGGGDDADATLTVRLTALPTDGTLFFTGTVTLADNSTVTYAGHQVTSADIAAGFTFAYTARSGLTYTNTGNRDQNPATPYSYGDGFDVVVADGGGGTATPGITGTHIAINVRPINDDPVLVSPPAPVATVTAAGDVLGTYQGAYVVTLTSALLNATDVDSSDDRLTFAVTSQAGLDQGSLLLDGRVLPVGGVFTMADVRAGRVQYVQRTGAAADDTDTFNFQLIDNTTSLRWDSDGTSLQRVGGVYDDSGTPGVLADDQPHTFTFTINLEPTGPGNGTGFTSPTYIAAHTDSNYAGTNAAGSSRGTVDENGVVVLGGTGSIFTTTPGLSYTVDGVPPSQVVYTILGLDGVSDPNWNGWIERLVGGTWVKLNAYDTFTQADLNAGAIRYEHNPDSEDFESSVRLSASAGVLVPDPADPGAVHPDNWTTTFSFYTRPVNDAPVVTGGSASVVAEGQTVSITIGQLRISDPDDATSEAYLEGTTLLPGGGTNFAVNNDATGADALKFVIDTAPAGGILQYSTDGGINWITVVTGPSPTATVIDASLITGDAGTTGLRFVSNGSETRATSFNVHAVDRWGTPSNSGTVNIQITNVNDPPSIASRPDLGDPTVPADAPNVIAGPSGHAPTNEPLTVNEGGKGVIGSALLQAYDPDSTATQVQYRITSVPAHGYIAYSTDGGATLAVLGVNSSFTQADIEAGRVFYVHDGTESAGTAYATGQDDKFIFTLSDGNGEQVNNEFWIYVAPANDAPVVTAPAGPIALGGASPADNPVAGFSVADPDLATITAGEQDFIQVTVRLLDSTGTAFGVGDYAGVSIGTTTLGGATQDGDKDGAGDYLTLRGTRAQVNAALGGLTVTFGSDRDRVYQVQVIADDRLRDPASGVLAAGANGGAVNDTVDPATADAPVPNTVYTWYGNAVPSTGDIVGNISAASVRVYASSVNEPVLTGAPAAQTVYEDQPTYIGGAFEVSDPESTAFGTPIKVTFSVPGGALGVGGSGADTSITLAGHQAVTVQGDNTGTLVLSGLASDIEFLINSGTATGLTYKSALNVNDDLNLGDLGDVTLRMSVDDSGSRIGGNVGAGSAANVPADTLIALTIAPVNDAPVVTLTGGVVADTPLFLTGAATPSPVTGFDVNDLDITNDIDNGSTADVTAGEVDFLQVTVRITETNGTPMAAGAYTGAVVIQSDHAVAGLVVDGTYDGTDSALVIRGTRAQVQSYLDGLQVSLQGGLANTDRGYHVEVIADDRLRDALGNLTGTAANGGENPSLPASGTTPVPTTAIDPYAATASDIAALSANVGLAYRTVFPSAINDPAHIDGTALTVAEAGGTVTLNTIDISDQDAQATSILTATVSVPAGFAITAVGGTGGSAVISGDGLSVVLTGTLTEINSRVDTIVVRLPDPAGTPTPADWNGTFAVTVVVDDNGNTGSRPGAGSLVPGSNDDHGLYTYENGTDNHLVTTRTFDVTVTPTDDAPVLGGTTGVRTVAENPNAAALPGVPEVRLVTAGTATLNDVDLSTTPGLPAFGSGSVTVSLGASYFAGDELVIADLSGTPLPAGFAFTGGAGGAPLVITFGPGTTAAEVTGVIDRLAYRSTSDNPTNYDTAANRQRTYTIVVNDGNNTQVGGANAGGPTALNSNVLTGTIAITAVDDAPVARDDTRSVGEDATPITGNVIAAGATGDLTDTDVDNRTTDLLIGAVRTGTELAGTGTAGTVGSGLAGAYGTLVLSASGSYAYTVDNANPTVNALKTGQTLTEVYTYTLSDGHGGADTAQLTITINGRTDGAPTITPTDGNGAATGQSTVFESGLTSNGPGGESATTTGTIALTAPDGLASVTVDGTVVTAAQLAALTPATPVVIDTVEGRLSLTGFAGGNLSYSYTLKAPLTQAGAESTDNISLVVTDLAGAPGTGTATGALTVRIVNDVPTAQPDVATITEDAAPGTVGGNVFTNDRIGADGAAAGGPVTAVGFGATAGTVGSALTTAYGSVVLAADGTYIYTLDNTNPTVNALKTGQMLTEVVNYTISDSDGNASPTTLTITIQGHTDGAPAITPVDGNSGATGQATVFESGLTPDGPAGQSRTAAGSITVSAADGLSALSVGGTVLTTAQLAALSAGTPVSVTTADGTLLLTGFSVDSRLGGSPTGVPTSGTLAYSYTLNAARTQPLPASESTDSIGLVVTDLAGAPSTGTATGTLTVRIVNDVPTAQPDTATITEDATPGTVGGNVFTNDRIGADGAATGGPVTAVGFGATTGAVGGALATTYGSVVLNANGSYVYTLDNTNPTVNALKTGQTLTEVVNYTITDGDGNTSPATLTVIIQGHTDAAAGPSIVPVDANGAASGQTDVLEHGLDDGPGGPDTTERNIGSIAVSAADGLTSVTIGGTVITAAQLQALGTTPIVITTPEGTLTLNGFTNVVLNGVVPIAGSITYAYTLDGQLAQPGATESVDPIALTVLDAGGATSTGVLQVRIVDDVPVAANDTAAVSEDGPAAVTGSVKANDANGADNANGVPVTGVAFGGSNGTVGAPLTTAYGSIVVNPDGSYSYTLNNADPAVQHLIAGETLTETVRYTITDADGDTSTATLTITIDGANDVPTLALVDGNGPTAVGQASVSEHGLGDAGDSSETTTGGFVIGAPDGLDSIVVGGTTVTPAQLGNLGATPVVIGTGLGEITLTGFDPATGVISYSYTLGANQPHGGGQVTDPIAITVRDRDGDTTSGTLTVLVIDDVPIARNDAASVGTALPGATVAGNVVGGASRGLGDVADRIGADYTPTPVTGFSFEGRAGVVGGEPLAGAYGSLRLVADGSYSYAVNASNARVAALGEGQTLTEVFNYTITDSDGSTSTARLVVTIQGASSRLPLAGDEIWPSDFRTPVRAITQGMQPALFVQLAVRESQRLSQTLTAGIATRVAGGMDQPYEEDRRDESIYDFGITQYMDPTEHVSRDGVAFSLAMVRDVELTLAKKGLGDNALDSDGNALFGLFNEFAGERIVVKGADTATAMQADMPAAAVPAHSARSFTERLHATAAERGTVRDRVKLQQHHREAARVKVPAAPR